MLKKIKIDKIILFGSRARGEATKYSDWDILIIVDDNMNFNEKRELKKLIRKTLAELLIPVDIIVKK
ncbi:MAG: nucleotidyltransferase domain-containing protein [Candidatus Odinarchaeum yellowstonii]|uniref:Nucleotidyltransferase domain-containing protein n=1 Tax=Odinarchaeota yellowstonii (strain LCB_4) TaxID=1841599 RepID=A0AAF0IAR8_ODILC|nr:MAG: nucleotidyltransferase domain-containing protein [Candidatus Odinarchaeum yellowstonii]